HNILHITSSIEDTAVRNKVSLDQLQAIINSGRQKLFALREQRGKPGRDEKVLTAWNGLMLTSFAEASAILGRSDYRSIAEANARFLLSHLQKDALLLRTYKDGEAKLNAYLEDYACFIDGLISLYEATGELTWIESAVSLADKMIEEFWDDGEGGFFFTGKSHEQLIVRAKEFMDNATPSGNSIATLSLLRLGLLTGSDDYRRRATAVLRLMADQIRRYPSAFGFTLSALDFYLDSPLEVVIVGSPQPGLDDLLRILWRTYLPNRVIALCQKDYQQAAAVVPLFIDRNTLAMQPTAFVCQDQTCRQPAENPDDLLNQLVPPNSRSLSHGS
ncbi:MAG: thioredoxin domain-containing protein, partial [Acidobacteriota bacterium]|nr:thioredoxin domain-containing protein [Acidobacteriota bacterium]